MRRLANGVFAVVKPDGDVELRLLGRVERIRIASDLAASTTRIALGIAGRSDAAAFEQLRAQGLAVDTRSPDEDIEARLAQLGQGYAWHVEHINDGAKIVVRLRHIHARRKLFHAAPWHLPALPESVLARADALTRRLGRRRRTALLGDFDAMSVALIALKHRVTVFEPDETRAAFLAALSSKIDVERLDPLSMVPDTLTGAFDAVVLQPPPVEGSLRPSIDRAALLLRTGGIACLPLHASARESLASAAGSLPFSSGERLQEHQAVLLAGYVEHPHALDLQFLERVEGHAPSGTDVDLSSMANTQLPVDRETHAYTDIEPTGPIAFRAVAEAVEEALAACGLPVTGRQEVSADRFNHLFIALERGGHLSLVHDGETQLVAYDVLPLDASLDHALTQALTARLPLAAPVVFSDDTRKPRARRGARR